MARPADPRRAAVRRSTLSRILTGLAQGLKWLLVSLFISILIEWVGMVFWWEDQGSAHSQQMLANELQYLGADSYYSGWAAHRVQAARDFPDRVYDLVFERIGIMELVHWITPVPSPHESGIRPVLHRLHGSVSEYVVAAMQMDAGLYRTTDHPGPVIARVRAVRLGGTGGRSGAPGSQALGRWPGKLLCVSLRQESHAAVVPVRLGAVSGVTGQRAPVLDPPAVRAGVCPGGQDHGRYLQEVPLNPVRNLRRSTVSCRVPVRC